MDEEDLQNHRAKASQDPALLVGIGLPLLPTNLKSQDHQNQRGGAVAEPRRKIPGVFALPPELGLR
jgi:hypothetical protein